MAPAAAAASAAPGPAAIGVRCTVCSGHASGPGVWPHPSLHHVAVCTRCFTRLCDGLRSAEEAADSEDEEAGPSADDDRCAWCHDEGVEVLCCDQCPRGFCADCIHRNLGAGQLQKIRDTDPWVCYRCDKTTADLADLRAPFLAGGRDQILTDQLMFNEEETEQTAQRLEERELQKIRQAVRDELGSTATEQKVDEEMAVYVQQHREKEELLQAQKQALFGALEPVLRAQGRSLVAVLKQRERMIAEQRGPEPASDSPSWQDYAGTLCCRDSSDDSEDEDEDEAGIEPTVGGDVAMRPPCPRKCTCAHCRASKEIAKRHKQLEKDYETSSAREELPPKYRVETPAEARDKGLSGAVDEISENVADDAEMGWHRSAVGNPRRRKPTREQVAKAESAERQRQSGLKRQAPRVRRMVPQRAAGRAAGTDAFQETAMSSEDSSEEEEPAPKPAAPRRRRKTPSPVRRELVPAWQGGGATGRSSADDLALGQYTGQAGTPVEISIASAEPVEPGWPALPGALKQHQKDGVRFMWKKTVRKAKGCILAHCMGLGKTLEAIAVMRTIFQYGLKLRDQLGVAVEVERQRVMEPALARERPACILVVAPKNTIYNWRDELKHWASKMTVAVVDSRMLKAQRLQERRDWYRTGGVLVMGNEMFVKCAQASPGAGRKSVLVGSDEHRARLRGMDASALADEALARGFERAEIEALQQPPAAGVPVEQSAKDRLCELLLEEAKWLQNPGPDMVIVDEAHKVKNDKGTLTETLSSVATMRRIAMTGTPFQNNLDEYYTMIDWVKPGSMGTPQQYRSHYVEPIEAGQHTDSTDDKVKKMKRRSHSLHRKVDRFMHRCDHGVLAKDLPSKHEFVLYVRLSKLQNDLYRTYLAFRDQAIKEDPHKNYFHALHHLSRVVTHPPMLRLAARNKEKAASGLVSPAPGRASPTAEDRERPLTPAPDGGDSDSWWKGVLPDEAPAAGGRGTQIDLSSSPKLIVLLELVRLCVKQHEKLLVFSKSTQTLDIVERALEATEHPDPSEDDKERAAGAASHASAPRWRKNAHYYRIDGNTDEHERQELCTRFNGDACRPGGCSVFLISTQAGGVGINLVAASRCVMLDDHHNPALNLQALFRCYRYGQTRPVVVYRLLSAGTMEEQIYRTVVTKQSLAQRIVDEGS